MRRVIIGMDPHKRSATIRLGRRSRSADTPYGESRLGHGLSLKAYHLIPPWGAHGVRSAG
jgi:hypothetical protein